MGSYPSNVWFVKSPRISRLICVSRVPPSVPCKKPLKPTWSVSLKTRTCAPFTPNVSPSCRKTSNLQDVFVASVLKQQQKPVNHTFYAIFVLFLIFQLGMKKKKIRHFNLFRFRLFVAPATISYHLLLILTACRVFFFVDKFTSFLFQNPTVVIYSSRKKKFPNWNRKKLNKFESIITHKQIRGRQFFFLLGCRSHVTQIFIHKFRVCVVGGWTILSYYNFFFCFLNNYHFNYVCTFTFLYHSRRVLYR